MTPQEQVKELTKQIVAKLCAITEHPNGWLPHTVWAEEECSMTGNPIYRQYILEEIHSDGTCNLCNPDSGKLEHTNYPLDEINIDWLIIVWNRYHELCIENNITSGHHTTIEDNTDGKELCVFIWSCHFADRNISDQELIEAWQNGFSQSKLEEDDELYEVEKLTPDELAERINDESFAHAQDYIRFIYLKKE